MNSWELNLRLKIWYETGVENSDKKSEILSLSLQKDTKLIITTGETILNPMDASLRMGRDTNVIFFCKPV